MSDTPRTDAECISIEIDWRDYEYVKSSVSRQLERELNAANSRITTLQTQLDQRWGMMRELEVECGTKDVAEAVKYIKGLKARIAALEKAGDVLDNHIACGCGVDGPCRHCAAALDGWSKAKGQQ